MDLSAIRKLVASDLKQVDQLIEHHLHSSIPLIQELAKHLIQAGGKRLRPLIVLLMAKILNYQGQSHISLAAIIEMVHAATLLHDDVVDASELRRGKQTANALWGNAASVLVGDFLYSRTFQMMVEVGSLSILKILAQATNVIAEGEVLQLHHCHNIQVTEEQYFEVLKTKTGTLFGVAAQVMPVLCGASETLIESALNYGCYLGVAFQLVDDALDYQASTETLGKKRGDDLAEGKPTLPLIYALKHADPAQQACLKQAVESTADFDMEQVLHMIEISGGIAYTYDKAQFYAERAIDALKPFPDSSYREALISLAQFALTRSF